MKKIYISPKNYCVEYCTVAMFATSGVNNKYDQWGDGWHSRKKTGWNAEDWTGGNDTEDEEDF